MTKPPLASPGTAPMPRRTFLKSALVTAAAVSTLPSRAVSAPRAPGKVDLACCGIGFRGNDIIKDLHRTGLANVVALCDTDMGARHTQEIISMFPDVPRFQDFRQMFDRMGKRFDAVSIATPDFSHFPIAMLAMSQGKHVYCEKPMGGTFHQIELMMQAEKKYKVAAQMGNQGHSDANYFQFKAWVDAGIIRNVTKITAHMNSERRWHGMNVSGLPTAQPIPDTLDWDTWTATGPFREYNRAYVNGDWRSWYDYGNGALGDWGAHIFDTAHEFLNLGLPTEVEVVKAEGWNPYIFPQATTLDFRFPARGSMPPLVLSWYDGQTNLPPLPNDIGEAIVDPDIPPPSRGTIDTKTLPPGKVIYGEDLVFRGGTHGSTLSIIPEAKAREMASKLPEVPPSPSNHFGNFLLSCMGEETCRSNFAVAGPLSQMMALGVIAQRCNAKLTFDPGTRQITNHRDANAMLEGPPPRQEWEQFFRL